MTDRPQLACTGRLATWSASRRRRDVARVAPNRSGDIPPVVSKLAIGSAIAGLLTPLYLVRPSFAWLIPASRFTGLIITGLTAIRLARKPGD